MQFNDYTIEELLTENLKLKQQNEELRQAISENNLSQINIQKIAEEVSDVILMTDMNLVTQFISPSISKLTGFTPEEHLLLTLEEKHPPESIKLVKQVYQQEMQLEKSPDSDPNRSRLIEIQYYHKDGSKIWTEINISFLRDNNGNPTGIKGVTRNIEKRKQIERDLILTKETYSNIFNTISEAIYIQEENGVFIDINKGVENIYGCDRDYIIGKTPADVAAPGMNNLDEITRVSLEVLDTGKPTRFDFWAIRQNGDIFPKEVIVNRGTYNGKVCLIATAREISDRIERENKIKQSEEKFRLIAENTSDGIIVFEDNRITYVSPSYLAINGYTEEEELGRTAQDIVDLIHPDDAAEVLDKIFSAQALQKESIKYEVRILHKAGHYYWREDHTKYIYNPDGTVKRTYIISRDINERKKLDERFEILRLAVEQSPASIVITDTNGNIEYVNPKFEESSGYKSEEVLGKNPRILKSGLQSEEVYKDLWTTISRGETWRGELHNKKKNGELFWELVSINPITNSNGETTNYLAIKENITERKFFEKLLIESEEKYRKIFENIQDIIYQTDMSGNIIDISPSIERHSGYKREELIGKQILEFYVKPNDRKNFVNELIRNSSVSNFEVELKAKDNRVVIASVNAQLIYDQEGNPEKIEGVLHDITDIKNAELALKESEAQFRSLFENAADAIFIADINTGIILDANNAASKLVKIPIEEIIGLHQTDLHPKEEENRSKESFIQHIADIEANNLSNLIETNVVASDGTLSVVEVLASTVNYQGRKAIMGIFRNISERKEYEKEFMQAKEAAVLNSANVTAIIENTTSSIWAFDAHYEIIYINKVFHDEFNAAFGVELVPGSNLLEALPDILQPIWKPRYDRVLQGEQFTFIDAVDTGFGIIYIEVSMNPITKNGEVVGGSCFASNVTERKIAEKELQHLNRMQSILMNIASKYINISLDRVDMTMQKSLEELGKFAQADRVYIFDYDWEKFVCNNTYEWCENGITAEINNLQNVPLGMMLDWVDAHKKGEAMYVPDVSQLPRGAVREILEPQGIKTVITVPMMDGNNCIGFVGFDSVINHHIYTQNEQKLLKVFAQMIVNIILRENLDRELISARDTAEENERKVRSMFENSLVGFLYCNDSGVLIEANPAALKMLGSPSLEDTKTINLLNFEPLVNVGFSPNLQKSIDNQVIITDEDIYTSKWGKTAYIKYYIIPLIKNDKVTGVWINLQDLTDIWKIQQDLITSKEKVEESDRLKAAFLQNISHEIRTPINGIVGFAKFLSEFDLSADERLEYADMLVKSCTRLLNTIDDIINLSRLDSNQIEINRNNLSPHDIIQTLDNKYRNRINSLGLKFIANTEKINSDLVISGDEYCFIQIIDCYLSNAEKFTKEGEIELGVFAVEKSVTFYVRDTGIGISEEHFEKVFERFYQTDLSISRGYEGSGLGLSLAKGLAELMGGEVYVESKVDLGSTFYFKLPLD
ncbi:MAG: PAS domain S-box protein [Candidatus Kapabacteria bacterium]|nr:PAS domain S-box protein [Ignavibacteriota bacterium]MCW5885772.1 PAS domain S-box protein [Candidatus Kapabacteria bacterium]